MTTYSRESDWASVPTSSSVASHRATTSSRHPGVVFAGTVRHAKNPLVICDACNQPRLLVGDGPHAPHYRSTGTGFELVDCVGNRLEGA